MHSKIFTEGNTSENPRDIAMKKKKNKTKKKIYKKKKKKRQVQVLIKFTLQEGKKTINKHINI